MRTKILSIILVGSLLFTPSQAVAHVMVADVHGTSGALLHVTPDDNPEAGAVTHLYFDVDQKTNLKDARIKLEVLSDTGGINEEIPVDRKGQVIASSIVFPVRGIYYLTLSIVPAIGGETVLFKYPLRVERSVLSPNPKRTIPFWAMAGFIGSLWALCALVLTGIRRKQGRK